MEFPNVQVNFTQDFYFSAREWTVDGFPRPQVPLRSIVKGTFNNTEFNNHYEFGSFRVGSPPRHARAALFGDCDVQRMINGDDEGNRPGSSVNAGAVVGLLIVGLLVGIIIGVVVMIFVKRRQVTTA